MPLYEYVCNDCETDFEVFHRSFSKIKPVSCAACDSDLVEKKISKSYFKLESGGTRSDSYYSDSSNIGKKVEDTFSSHGMDMPHSIKDSIDSARKGKMPDGLDL
mgnify:CR=1 FL=1